MSSRLEFVSPEGLRVDGRRANEVRKVTCQLGLCSKSDGSALFAMGNSRVLAAVYGPREARTRARVLHDRATICCSCGTASFSAVGERTRREKARRDRNASASASGGGGDRASKEVAHMLRQTFESVILTRLFPRSEINIFVQVLQADGGVRNACINAATLALLNAGVPMRDYVVSCSAGVLDSTPVVDLNHLEDSAGGPDLSVALLPKCSKLSSVQMDNKVSLDLFDSVLEMATEGCKQIYQVMEREVRENAASLIESRGLS